MPHNSLLFWKKLLRKRLPPGCLSQLNYTCFGLGDSTYIKYASSSCLVILQNMFLRPSLELTMNSDRFNWAARKLIRRLEQLGASTFLDCFEADERFNDG